jgi:hypothetical protein
MHASHQPSPHVPGELSESFADIKRRWQCSARTWIGTVPVPWCVPYLDALHPPLLLYFCACVFIYFYFCFCFFDVYHHSRISMHYTHTLSQHTLQTVTELKTWLLNCSSRNKTHRKVETVVASVHGTGSLAASRVSEVLICKSKR